jgi:hypothetical protein
MSSRLRRERTRHDHVPEVLRVLFVAESPPSGGTFFYDRNSILSAATREVFLRAMPSLSREADFLRAFQRLGCCLEDLSLDPIDRLLDKEKRQGRSGRGWQWWRELHRRTDASRDRWKRRGVLVTEN